MAGSNIVNLDEMVPGIKGTVFKYDGKEYRLRGDLPTKTVFEMLSLYDDLIEFRESAQKAAETNDPKAILAMREALDNATGRINEKLLEVFQLEHPTMKELPFGGQSTIIVLGEVLKAVGIGANPPEAAPKPRNRTSSTSRKVPSQRRSAAGRR